MRCEFFDDEIDSLGEFELDTQPQPRAGAPAARGGGAARPRRRGRGGKARAHRREAREKGRRGRAREDAPRRRREPAPAHCAVRERPRARGGLSAKNYGGGLSRAADDCGRGGVRPHRREPEGLFVAAEGGRLHRVRKRLARGRACGAGTERGRADGEARRLRPLSDGEPADEPVSARAAGAAADHGQAALGLRRQSRHGGNGSCPLSDGRVPRAGALRRRGACAQPPAPAAGAEDPGGARPRGCARSGEGRRADLRRGTLGGV